MLEFITDIVNDILQSAAYDTLIVYPCWVEGCKTVATMDSPRHLCYDHWLDWFDGRMEIPDAQHSESGRRLPDKGGATKYCRLRIVPEDGMLMEDGSAYTSRVCSMEMGERGCPLHGQHDDYITEFDGKTCKIHRP